VLGAPVRLGALFEDRFTRPFDLEAKPKFFVNPCELAPIGERQGTKGEGRQEKKAGSAIPLDTRQFCLSSDTGHATARLDLFRPLVEERAELPVSAITETSRMLSDLHLNSITVGQVVGEAARRLGLPRVSGLTNFANATVGEIERAFKE